MQTPTAPMIQPRRMSVRSLRTSKASWHPASMQTAIGIGLPGQCTTTKACQSRHQHIGADSVLITSLLGRRHFATAATTAFLQKDNDGWHVHLQGQRVCTKAAAATASPAMQPIGEDSHHQQHLSAQQPTHQAHNAVATTSNRSNKQSTAENINNLPALPSPTQGFRLPPAAPITWTFMISYLVFMLIVPIVALLTKASQTPVAVFISRAFEPVAVHAYFVSFSCALAAAAANAVFGFLLAWVLVKYDFPGRKWIDAAVDLPFALPTSVAGLTLATVYSDETFLGRLLEGMGIPIVFTRLGVALAMVFVSFPFVVRTMQPVIQEMQPELEEAAWTLGATPWKTFTQVLLPPLLPPLLTGTALAFSRALGEFGSIVIISSNFAFKDLIAPVLIFQCLEQYDFTGATIIGTMLLGISLVIMLLVNWVQTLGAKFKNS